MLPVVLIWDMLPPSRCPGDTPHRCPEGSARCMADLAAEAWPLTVGVTGHVPWPQL